MSKITWLTDTNGNRCSVEWFGSKEAAQAALDTLKECVNCTNCSGCSDCSDCSRCSICSRCSGCSGCSDCSDCSRCSICSDCSRCSICSDCSRCSGCSGCSDCSRCSICSRCSRCSYVAYLRDKKDIQGDPDSTTKTLGQPPIPKIVNIHQRILELAVASPGALDMSTWHTCNTTHCRAGWVVHESGEAGYALERFHNTALAAQLIYRESSPELPVSPVRFYESNTQALDDMKAMAAKERGAV